MFGLDACDLPWSPGRRRACGARPCAAVRCVSAPCRPNGHIAEPSPTTARVGLGVRGCIVCSCASTIEHVVAPGEWSSSVAQDHPGDLCQPGSERGVLRCDFSCWTGCLSSQYSERPRPLGRWAPAARQDVRGTACRRVDFGDRIDLLPDERLHQGGRECGLQLRTERKLRSIDAGPTGFARRRCCRSSVINRRTNSAGDFAE